MVREFIKLVDIYTPPDKNGNQKLVMKDVESKLLINMQDIRYVEPFINKKGKEIKNRCFIKVDNETFLLKHKFEDFKNLIYIKETNRPIGFEYKGRRI